MPNYNSTLQSNNIDLQAILNTINELPEAGGSDPVLQDKTVTPTTSRQSITADSGYDGLDTVTVNAMPTATQATPAITVNASGLITATATQTAGYVAAGSKSATKQLAFQAAKTITPTTTSQTAVSSGYYTGGAVTVKGDSNLVAGNIKSGVSIFGVNGTYAGNGGGDTSMEDGMITRTATSYMNSRVTKIGRYAFANYSELRSVNFPEVITIEEYAFYNCSRLTTVSFPKATTINGYVFSYCSNLTKVNFPEVMTVGSNAFYSCSRLTTASFPKATTISSRAFERCHKLATISFPMVTTIGRSAFTYCHSLTTASFPSATTIYGSAFVGCSNLATVSLPKVSAIGNYAFSQCFNLISLYLTGSSLCRLSGSDAFSRTPIVGFSTSTSALGSIYVPASLLNSYKRATNWTYFSSRIVGI